MRTKVFRILFGIVVLLTPLSLAAAPVLRSGESVTISETQEVGSDFYAVGGAVTVSGTVGGDLYAAAGTVTVNGEIEGDAVIVGGSVRIDGAVGDDVRVIGGELVIADTVKGDVLVLGGVVRILSTAQIDGDILFLGGEVSMDGDLRGSLSGRAETVRINGPVLGNVSVSTAKALELGDQAHIEGTVEYASVSDVVRAPGSVVIGDITKKQMIDTRDPVSSHALPLLAFFFTTIAYLFLFKRKLERLMRHTLGAFGQHGLLGFGVFALSPIVASVLLVSIIGLPLGLALFLCYFLLLAVAVSSSGIFVGALLARYFDGEVVLSLKWTLLGTLTLALLLYIPYLGPLLVAVISLALIGGMATLLYTKVRA